MASTLQNWLGRTGIGRLLGFQMNGLRNLYAIFGWETQPTFKTYLMKYKRQAVAKRVVHAYPDALWADPPIVTGDPTFLVAWQDLLAAQPVFPTLQKLDKLCRIGRYAVLVIGLDDGKALNTPVSKLRDATKAQRKILYMQPYCEDSVQIKKYDEDQKSPRYGMPEMYTISPGEFENLSGNATVQVSPVRRSFDVHWSRCLHVAENALESNVYGTPALEPILNDLYDLEKVTGGSAEVFWLNSNRGLHVDVDKEMELKPEDAEALEEEIDEYSHNLRRVMRTRGVKITSLGTDFLDPRGVYDVAISNIAAGTGIPKRVLSGSEAGQLASQQDRANWADRCDERVSEYGNPVVLMPFLRLLIDSAVLPVPSMMAVKWPDQFKMNPLERAQTSAQMARSAANLAKTLYTVQQINHANAVDATPQPLVTGGFGGTFGANASTDPSKSSSGTVKNPSGAPPDATGSKTGTTATPEPQMQPALIPNAKTDLVLLTEEECRRIIGFGKHMPVFDDAQDAGAKSKTSVGDPTPPEDVSAE